MSNPAIDYHEYFTGLDTLAPVLNGTSIPYINFDNSASTPSFKHVQNVINQFLDFYSSVHRGTGFKSQLSTEVYESARHEILKFAGANPENSVCIFGKNTTEAINKLARRFPFTAKRRVVLTTSMEHHSNDLPWRAVGVNVVHVRSLPDGRLDEADFDEKLKLYQDQIALASVSGASNVTGFINPIHRLAEKVHTAGGDMVVDCAQLAPHRQIRMGEPDDPARIDFIALSAHKMYAPFGSGALVGRREIFEHGAPDMVGGGQVEIVSLDQVEWSSPPNREEAGSPNTIGAIAMAAAASQLEAIGMGNVAAHEAQLTAYALEQLISVPGIQIYGDRNPDTSTQRLGVIPFNLEGIPHYLTAAILGYEFGIGVRNGCFCAHPYMLHLLGVGPSEAQLVRQHILDSDRSQVPGLVRISFGLYNSSDEVDRVVDAIKAIVSGKYFGNYHQDIASGEFHPENWPVDFKKYFSFNVQDTVK